MAEFYKFVGSGIVKCDNENSCRNCKYRLTIPNKKNEIWCDFVDVIPTGFIVSHKNCNHFKWSIQEAEGE